MREPRTFVEQRMNRCRHFTGIQNDTCKLGVAYADVKRQRPNGGFNFPCLADQQLDTCDKRVFETREEADAAEREFAAELEKVQQSRKAIIAWAVGRRGIQGEIPCPVDGGTLHFTIASVNGHIHAACSNDGCVRWME